MNFKNVTPRAKLSNAQRIALQKRAVVLYPRRSYLSESSVLHARRKWITRQVELLERGFKPFLPLQLAAAVKAAGQTA